MNEIIISQIRQRLEILYQMVDELERSGGGGGEPGTTNYNDLTNKPSVNGHILIGSKTSSDLDLQPVISDLSAIRSGAALGATAVQPATMNQALSHKQDTLTFDSTPTSGSTNPVTSGGVYTSLTTKVDKVTGKDLSTNDFTNADKAQITTNKNSIAAVANRGSKNIFKNTANSKTYNGVTFNVNADGTVSTSGSATPAVAVLEIGYVTLAAGTYIVSGCPEGGAWSDGANKYRIRVAVNNSWRGDDKGNGFSVTLNEGDTVSLQINTAIGLDATGLVFKPMIRPASIEDSTYVPYGMTNAELTAKEDQLENDISLLAMHKVYSSVRNTSTSHTYAMQTSDFNGSQVGTYLITIVTWSTTPSFSLYAASYSGNQIAVTNLTKIAGADANISLTDGVISCTTSGKIQIIAVR